MLKTMRASFHKLKWTLFAVIIVFVLGFVFFSGDTRTADPAKQAVAEIKGERILAAEFDRQYQAQLQRYREMYRGAMSPQIARALNLPRQVLDGMIDRILMLEAARRLKLRVTDEEVARKVVTLFSRDGRFIGREEYEKILRGNRISPQRFEEEIREDMLREKYSALVNSSVLIPESEVAREFSVRNDKATIEYILVPAARLESAAEPADAELKAFYEKNRERYRAAEQRRIKYLLVDRARIRAGTKVSDAEIQAEYARRRDSFTTPEQANASHILIKVDEGTTEAEARAKAEAILAKAKAGEDFVKLANESTEDESGKGKGGQLPPFGRGQMVKPFENAAFAMAPGELRLVQTQFGFHVIKLHSKTPAQARPFEEVRPSLEAEIADKKAAAEMDRIARELSEKLKGMRRASDEELRKLQDDRITYNTTGWASQGETVEGIGSNPGFAEQAWSTKLNEISATPVATARGTAFVRPFEERPAGVPPLAEIRERVVNDWKAERREKDALAALDPAARELASGTTLGTLASRYETEVKTTPEFAPGGPVPEIGLAPLLSEAVFKTPAGQAGPPVPVPGGFVVFRVLTRQEGDRKNLETQKAEILESLRSREGEKLLRSYLKQVRAEAGIRVNEKLLESFLPQEEGAGRGRQS